MIRKSLELAYLRGQSDAYVDIIAELERGPVWRLRAALSKAFRAVSGWIRPCE
jgi:hypothetical protein